MEDSAKEPAVQDGAAAPEPPQSTPPRSCDAPKPNTPKPCNARQCLGRSLARTDALLLRLNDLISTAYGQERVLATIGYTSQIIHYSLNSRAVRPIITGLSSRLCQTKSSPPKSDHASTPHLLALASYISELRTALRLFDLIRFWEWGSSTVKSPPHDPVLRAVIYAQVISNVIYQFLENVAFLASKGIISKRAVEKWGSLGKWSIWSTRAWLGHILLEFVRLARARQLAAREAKVLKANTAGNEKEGSKPDEDTRKAMAKAKSQQLRQWKKGLLGNLAWTPLCLHWSFDNGVGVPDNMVGLLSLTAVAWGVSDLWKATAR